MFNLVTGDGPSVGEAIAEHPGIDMVSFTGSTRAGKRVSELASATVKRVALELGGKSPNVILDDADLAKAVRGGVQNCFLNSGQTCSAWTRMIVPRSRHDEVVRIAKETAEAFKVGGSLAEGTRLGPLVSQRQQERSYCCFSSGTSWNQSGGRRPSGSKSRSPKAAAEPSRAR